MNEEVNVYQWNGEWFCLRCGAKVENKGICVNCGLHFIWEEE